MKAADGRYRLRPLHKTEHRKHNTFLSYHGRHYHRKLCACRRGGHPRQGAPECPGQRPGPAGPGNRRGLSESKRRARTSAACPRVAHAGHFQPGRPAGHAGREDPQPRRVRLLCSNGGGCGGLCPPRGARERGAARGEGQVHGYRRNRTQRGSRGRRHRCGRNRSRRIHHSTGRRAPVTHHRPGHPQNTGTGGCAVCRETRDPVHR